MSATKIKKMITKDKKEIAKKRILEYFQKTSKHLFVEGKTFHKVIFFEYEDKWFYINLNFDGKEYSNVEIKEINYFEPGSLRYYKDELFPMYSAKSRKAIKNFKAMKKMVSEITGLVNKEFKGSTGYSDNKELKEKIKNLLNGMELSL